MKYRCIQKQKRESIPIDSSHLEGFFWPRIPSTTAARSNRRSPSVPIRLISDSDETPFLPMDKLWIPGAGETTYRAR